LQDVDITKLPKLDVISWALMTGAVLMVAITIVRLCLKHLRATTDPQVARQRVWLRTEFGLYTILVVLGVLTFAIGLLGLQAPEGIPRWLPFGVSITALALFMYYYIEARIPCRFFCRECQHQLPDDIGWICKACKNSNKRNEYGLYTFLHKCQNCGEVPLEYTCQHCGTVIDFQTSRDEQSSTIRGAAVPQSLQTHINEQRQNELDTLRHQISVAALEAELAQKLTNRKLQREILEPPIQAAPKTAKVKLQQVLDAAAANDLAAQEVAAEFLQDAETKWKSNPELLERHRAVVRRFLEQHVL